MTDGSKSKQRTAVRRLSPRTRLIALVLAALVVSVYIAQWLQHRLNHVSESDARVAADVITISSRLPGLVKQFTLLAGDHLAEDDAVAQLYSRPDEIELDQLRAQVARLEEQLEVDRQRIALVQSQIRGGIQQARQVLEADVAAADAAEAELVRSRRDYQRADRLHKAGDVSEQQRDTDYYQYKVATAAYQRAQKQVEVGHIALANAETGMLSSPQIALPNPEILRSELRVTQQLLAEARAEFDRQQIRLDDLTVRSPIRGVIDQTFIQQGEYISAGQPILMMHDPGKVWIEANIKETKIDKLRLGQPVIIHVDARPNLHYRGHVWVIGRATTSQFALLPNPNPSGNFTKIAQRIPVRIAIDHGPKSELSPGMMVTIDINVSAPQ